jgi:hypothetical protein
MDARAAVWTGDRVLVLGGETKSGPIDDIVSFDPQAPFSEDDGGVGSTLLVGLAVAGGVILLATSAWTVRRWREPPSMSGGIFRG